jgi:hypothetical protein
MHSPVAPPTTATALDSSTSPSHNRNRSSRPTSWDSTREIKPLYLLEKTSSSSYSAASPHHSAVVVEPPQDEYPALPPSEPPSSRESPGLDFEGEGREEGVVDYLGITRGAGSELQQVLSIDAGLPNKGEEVRFGEPLAASLGSGETTPRAVSFTGEEIGVGRDEEQERAAESFSPVPMDVVRLRHLTEDLETLPPLPESILASPVLSAVAPAAEEDLEKLPALPESSPASPLLTALPPAATRLLTDRELADLPALPESEPASPVLEGLPPVSNPPLAAVEPELTSLPPTITDAPVPENLDDATEQPLSGTVSSSPEPLSHIADAPTSPLTRPSMPGNWVTETLSTPEEMPGEAAEAERVPTENDVAAQLPLPESRPDSPVQGVYLLPGLGI